MELKPLPHRYIVDNRLTCKIYLLVSIILYLSTDVISSIVVDDNINIYSKKGKTQGEIDGTQILFNSYIYI